MQYKSKKAGNHLEGKSHLAGRISCICIKILCIAEITAWSGSEKKKTARQITCF